MSAKSRHRKAPAKASAKPVRRTMKAPASAKKAGKVTARPAKKPPAAKPMAKKATLAAKAPPEKKASATKATAPLAPKAIVAKNPPKPAAIIHARPMAKPPIGQPPAPAAAPPPPPPPPPPPEPKPKPPPVRRPLVTLTVATRRSALAVAQAELVLTRLNERLPQYAFKLLKLNTTGDQQESWSLEQQGGQGLFTGELEAAINDRRADIAVHSAKDLPTEMTEGLEIAGYLPREDPRDVLVIREGLARPSSIATGSPRRRTQLQRQFVKATFTEIRGNVETRLKKIAEESLADATVVAAAGLNRLGITEWPGLRFQPLPLAVSVPAVGQGAIAVQARGATAAALRPHLDELAARAVELERTFLRMLGGGCHTAFAIHYDGTAVHIFHDSCGYQRFAVPPVEAIEPLRVADRLLTQLKLKP